MPLAGSGRGPTFDDDTIAVAGAGSGDLIPEPRSKQPHGEYDHSIDYEPTTSPGVTGGSGQNQQGTNRFLEFATRNTDGGIPGTSYRTDTDEGVGGGGTPGLNRFYEFATRNTDGGIPGTSYRTDTDDGVGGGGGPGGGNVVDNTQNAINDAVNDATPSPSDLVDTPDIPGLGTIAIAVLGLVLLGFGASEVTQ